METIYSFLFLLQTSITWCYTIILPLFLTYLVLKYQRPVLLNMLSAINFCLGSLSIFNLYALVMMLNDVIHRSSGSLFDSSFGRTLLAMSIAILLLTAIELLFLIKRKLRISWLLSFAALLLVNWYLFYNWMAGLIFSGSLSRPLAISYSSTLHEKWLRILIFIVMVSACYVFLAISKKLPFPGPGFFKRREHVH